MLCHVLFFCRYTCESAWENMKVLGADDEKVHTHIDTLTILRFRHLRHAFPRARVGCPPEAGFEVEAEAEPDSEEELEPDFEG